MHHCKAQALGMLEAGLQVTLAQVAQRHPLATRLAEKELLDQGLSFMHPWNLK